MLERDKNEIQRLIWFFSQISQYSPHRLILIRDDTLHINGIFCIKEISSKQKSKKVLSQISFSELHRIMWVDSLSTCSLFVLSLVQISCHI